MKCPRNSSPGGADQVRERSHTRGSVPDDDGYGCCHLSVCGRDGGRDRQRVRGQLPVTHGVSAHAYLGENSPELDVVGQGVRGMPLDRLGQRFHVRYRDTDASRPNAIRPEATLSDAAAQSPL